MHKPLVSFPYFGSKRRSVEAILDNINTVCPDYDILVEPFMGSGCVSINSGKPFIGFESRSDVVRIFELLQCTTDEELRLLYDTVVDVLTLHGSYYSNNSDIPIIYKFREFLKYSCGTVRGATSTYKMTGVFNRKIIDSLPAFSRGIVYHQDVMLTPWDDYLCLDKQHVFFVDPPYIDTIAPYASITPTDIVKLVAELNRYGTVIFTYSGDCYNLFPKYDWQLLKFRNTRNRVYGSASHGTDKVREDYITVIL